MVDLHEAAEGVRDKNDVANLVGKLGNDFKNDPASWENITVDRFLEALSAWLEDADQLYCNLNQPLPIVPSWQFIAKMLLAAKIYE